MSKVKELAKKLKEIMLNVPHEQLANGYAKQENLLVEAHYQMNSCMKCCQSDANLALKEWLREGPE